MKTAMQLMRTSNQCNSLFYHLVLKELFAPVKNRLDISLMYSKLL